MQSPLRGPEGQRRIQKEQERASARPAQSVQHLVGSRLFAH